MLRNRHPSQETTSVTRVCYLDEALGLQDIDLMRVRGVPAVAWAVHTYKGMVRARLEDGNTRNVRLSGLDDETTDLIVPNPNDRQQAVLGRREFRQKALMDRTPGG
jgi:hypothetical protein